MRIIIIIVKSISVSIMRKFIKEPKKQQQQQQQPQHRQLNPYIHQAIKNKMCKRSGNKGEL